MKIPTDYRDADQKRRKEILAVLLDEYRNQAHLADMSPKQFREFRDYLEEELLFLSNIAGTSSLTTNDIKYRQGPVYDYFEARSCSETLIACITDACAERRPECFTRKMKKQIDSLLKILDAYWEPPEELPTDVQTSKNMVFSLPAESKKPEKSAGEKRVLVVDDDEYQIKLLKYKLVKDGYIVNGAGNGLEALEEMKKEHFDLIVCDLMMPGMDGFLFLQNIKQNPATCKVPLIFLTSVNDEQSIVKGLELGADDYMTKPYSPTELNMRIKKLIR